MEDIPPEVRKAMAEMKWHERLQEARARREIVLREKKLEQDAKDEPSAPNPPATDVEAIEAFRFGETLPAVIEHHAPDRGRLSGRRFVGLAFVAGISVGIGAMLFQNQLFEQAPVVVAGQDILSPESGGNGVAP